DVEGLAGGQHLDAAAAADAVHGFEVIAIAHAGRGAGEDDRLVEREAHPVALEQQAAAHPVGALDLARAAAQITNLTDDHERTSAVPPQPLAFLALLARSNAVATARPMM